jgi:hypothetical protein
VEVKVGGFMEGKGGGSGDAGQEGDLWGRLSIDQFLRSVACVFTRMGTSIAEV